MLGRRTCKIDGCTRLGRIRGKNNNGIQTYGSKCYKHSGSLESQARRKKKTCRWMCDLDLNLCSICGWHGPCDKHRIKWGMNGGGYTKGNVMIICPNCHRLIHKGLLEIS